MAVSVPRPARVSAMVSDSPHHRRVRGPVPAVVEALCGVQPAVAFERRNGPLRRPDGDRARLARDAFDFEPPVRVRLPDAVVQVSETVHQFRPVDRTDRHLAPEQPVIDHRAPLAVAALDHVGDHAMDVKLRIEIARGVVSEDSLALNLISKLNISYCFNICF